MDGGSMSTSTQPKTLTRRRTRVTIPLGGPSHYRQVQYWDANMCIWCDFGDPVHGQAGDVLEAKRVRCEEGGKP